jgi:protein-S-isoprenylcysteine O-methyltransferase Ste14
VRRTRAAAIGSALFFLAGPGLEAGAGPWLLTRTGVWAAHGWPVVVRALGALLMATGLAALVSVFARFVTEGQGTPSPAAPTDRLIVGGAYRHVRNPMYLATAAVIVGEALAFAQPILLLAAAVYCVALAILGQVVEEPLRRVLRGVPARGPGVAAAAAALGPRRRSRSAALGRELREDPVGVELVTPVGAPGDEHVVAGAQVERQLALDGIPLVVLADELVDLVERPPPDALAPRGREARGVVAVALAELVVGLRQLLAVALRRPRDLAQPLHVAGHHGAAEIGLHRPLREQLPLGQRADGPVVDAAAGDVPLGRRGEETVGIVVRHGRRVSR